MHIYFRAQQSIKTNAIHLNASLDPTCSSTKVKDQPASLGMMCGQDVFLEAHLLLLPGYLGHSAHTPGSFSMSYAKTLLQINSCESVYGLARLHTYITIN